MTGENYRPEFYHRTAGPEPNSESLPGRDTARKPRPTDTRVEFRTIETTNDALYSSKSRIVIALLVSEHVHRIKIRACYQPYNKKVLRDNANDTYKRLYLTVKDISKK